MSIDVQPRAQSDIEIAVDELRGWRVGAAERLVDRLDDALATLERLPHFSARYGATDPALAELRVYPIPRDYGYLVFYLPTGDGIAVVRVLHHSRNIAAIFNPDPDSPTPA
jgi:plasmid stabilization system protein ParE